MSCNTLKIIIFRALWLWLFKKIELLSNFVLSFFNIGEVSECDFACIDDGKSPHALVQMFI